MRIAKDMEFLKDLQLLDYSVLLGIETLESDETPGLVDSNNDEDDYKFKDSIYESRFLDSTERHQFYSRCGQYRYHIAIIDYLTDFNYKKRIESMYKLYIKRKGGMGISAVPPKYYGPRFC